MSYQRLAFLTVIALLMTCTASGQKLRGNIVELEYSDEAEYSEDHLGRADLLLGNSNKSSKNENGIISGTSNENENGNDSHVVRGFLGNVWCSMFNCKDDLSDHGDSRVGILVDNTIDTSDGEDQSKPAAITVSEDSTTPVVREFVQGLLNETNSKTTVKDFIDQAYKRSDTALLDYIAVCLGLSKETLYAALLRI